MKLTALKPVTSKGAIYAVGAAFEIDDVSAARLISLGIACKEGDKVAVKAAAAPKTVPVAPVEAPKVAAKPIKAKKAK